MKKKLLTSIVCFGLCGAMAFGVAGCGNKGAGRDPETDALKLAIGAVDQKFNPLFYTAENDGEIANMTQISLVTSEVVGDNAVLAYGEDQPSFALDYQETYYDANGKAIGSGTGDGAVAGRSDAEGSTVYEFVIKNGVQDSTGTDLTVMDALFNLYVYLDPAYSGSSTIYSTKIKGLQAYRLQDPAATEDSAEDNLTYYAYAENRINALIDWSEDGGGVENLTEDQKADLEKVKDLYLDELTSDWNSTVGSWVESYKDYTFTEEWQVYMYIEGIVQRQTYTNAQGGTSYRTDANGKYLTSLDPDETNTVVHQNLIDEVAAATAGLTDEYEILEAKKEYCINQVYGANTIDTQIDYILTYCNTAGTALEYFMADERSKAFEDKLVDGQLAVPSISGITVSKASSLKNEYTGETTSYGEDHDILRIEIDGVDPKAKWNFSVTIAPMHYYSDKAHYDKAMAAYNAGKLYDNSCVDFGVEFNDIAWFNDVLTASEKNGLPVGAGAYKAVSYNWTDTTNRTEFFHNNIAYFARNPYFETLGSGVNNAVINRVQYKVYADDKIVSALQTGEIDYGEPIATATNLSAFKDNLRTITYLTGGYGYAGINPKYVPDIEVRQAIMHAFDTSSIVSYYGTDLVNLINRPISSTSWADPKAKDRYYERWTDPNQIIELVETSGNWYYDDADGKLKGVADDQPLKLTFTIAGETTDHPAFRMFEAAQKFLNSCGFEITVQQDITALQKLVTGDLAVWAAAWSSSIDPDPYQVYSKNSNASSTNNWYKNGILRDDGSTFGAEQVIVDELAELIDEGRSTLNQAERKEIYAQTLDLIMNLAVEFPTYQRNDLCVYNDNVLDSSTMTAEPSYLMGPIAELWKLGYKK